MGRKNGNELSHTHTTHKWGENEKGWLLLPFRGAAEETGEEKKRSTKSKKKQGNVRRLFSLFSLPLSRSPLPLPLSRNTPHSARLNRRSLRSRHSSISLSDARGVQHHPHSRPQRRRRQVLGELRADGARAAVRPRDAAPDHAEPGAALEGLGLVDVGEALFVVVVG